jgi:hypothetical protein
MPPPFKTKKGYEVRQSAWRKNDLSTLVERSDLARSFRGEGGKEHNVHPQVRYDQCISTLRQATFALLARGI